ncbi:MAG: CheR family methyltransferase [Sedimentisphaerales bacterium]
MYLMNDIPALSESEFELFQKLLIEESGLYFDKDKVDSLCPALWERIQKREYHSYEEYYNLLRFNPDGKLELRNLFDLITIGETYFFRNEPQFEALMKYVLPEIVQAKMYSMDKSIKIWSAGCSRGTEPYSIAIAIMEAFPSYGSWNISILGTDINRDALIRAKEAVYSERDIGHLPEGCLDKYFKKTGKDYILNENVKKLVRFEYYNLAKGPFTQEGMQNLDIIFCRNVIIYFNSQTINQVINHFYGSLRPDGYLFLGHAENLWQIPNKFTTIEFPNTFLYKKVLHPIKEKVIEPFMAIPDINLEELSPIKKTDIDAGFFTEKTKPSPTEKTKQPEKFAKSELKEDIESLHQKAITLLNEKHYQDALLLFDKIITWDKNCIRAYFAKATILANQAKYNEAMAELKKIIEVDNLHGQAYYLSGVLAYKIGNLKEAEAQFKKVIYIDPDIVLAYYNLGNIYLYQKKFKQADKEFNNAVRLLEKRPKEERVRFCEDFTAEFLLRACRNSLAKIQGTKSAGSHLQHTFQKS